MKAHFTFLCFIISGVLANATIQVSVSQDKPPRLYVKSYTEKNIGFTKQIDLNISSHFREELNWTVKDSLNWLDGSAGNYSGTVFQTYDNGGFQWSTYNAELISWPQQWWPNTSATRYETYISTLIPSQNVTNYAVPDGARVAFEHCDTGAPIVNNSGTYGPSGGWITIISAVEQRTAQTTMKLQTGGKAMSRIRNLFGFSGSATRYDSQHWSYGGCYEGPSGQMFLAYGILLGCYPYATSIPAQNITIGSYGALGTNGVKYLALPDNQDVDVTPYVAGVKYYSFSLGQPQKYHSYFDLYVQQANPGYSLIFYNPTNDVGHAFWRFRTDAPVDALQNISTSLTQFLGTNWGFYPMNGLFTVPGVLQNDSSHSYNIKRSFYIGFPDLIQGLIFTRGLLNAPPIYSLTGYNCVSAARDAGFTADIFGLPWDMTPQNFGVTLIQMYPGPGLNIGPFIDNNDIFYSSTPY